MTQGDETGTDRIFVHGAEYAEGGIRRGRALQAELLRALVRGVARRLAGRWRSGVDRGTRPPGSTGAARP